MRPYHNTGRNLVPVDRRPSIERYQRAQTYSLLIGLTPVCLAPGRQRTPVRSLVVQADLGNQANITVGNSQVTLTNGLQLDPGRAWVFSVSKDDMIGSMFPTITGMTDIIRERNITIPGDYEIYLDVADFYAITTLATQRLRILWTTVVR